ncbi:DotU family type IV/VI secretion system protein [Roseisolibacter sp. H3M3-2]|uniref:DotU family type IV/VI secretion system protein n=1 Tax=Roseisolibacter sp. H3M3-2 TaxID=3031323 RepID=UPI0023DC00F3|nr:DotU family type IV/VI secretion system protein [Roseisolibacter sp. H3M3-2]MDF1505622.1 DotU family type IV/VI secretion system protein [Roseisolibacter sp. H3M3-2]
MTAPFLAPPAPAPTVPAGDVLARGRLARLFQEALTAVVRLRAGRQAVPDAVAFRQQMTQLLQRADAEARQQGYAPDDARLAVFAVVALLDESALNSRQPALADWARRPLQDELFGGHLAGEWFFQHVEQLLARPDSAALADLLEVHQLVLLLGFRGRYGHDTAALQTIAHRVGERLARLTGDAGPLAPAWRPPADAVVSRDPWLRRLTIALAASALLAVALWGAGAVTLGGTAAEVRALSTR